jgi:hypothetical protein
LNPQRKSDAFLGFLGIMILVIGLLYLDARLSQRIDVSASRERRAIVRVLNLTDLCLVTEARYTRHPSMADLHTAFQEHPLSLEHFPSGSFIAVPPHMRTAGVQ